MLEWGFQLAWGKSLILHKFRSKLPICNNQSFCDQGNLLDGQFWAMGRFNLLGGQSNLLGGHLLTQLTCYLPPWDLPLIQKVVWYIFSAI